MQKKLLVLVDFSEATEVVVEAAMALAVPLEAMVYLLHVAAPETEFVGVGIGAVGVPHDVERDLRREHEELNRLCDQVKARGLNVTALLIQGPVVEKILSEAKHLEVDYLVLGSHGHGAIYHALMGSVSEGVLRDAPCPVLLVKAEG